MGCSNPPGLAVDVTAGPEVAEVELVVGGMVSRGRVEGAGHSARNARDGQVTMPFELEVTPGCTPDLLCKVVFASSSIGETISTCASQ